jgi:hypothetical protein
MARRAIELPGKSQRGLARHLGYDDATVSKMVSGQRSLKTSEIEDMAIYFGTHPYGDRVKAKIPATPVPDINTIVEEVLRRIGARLLARERA